MGKMREHQEITISDVRRICGCGKNKGYAMLKSMREYIGHREFYTFGDFYLWRNKSEGMSQSGLCDIIEEICGKVLEKHRSSRWNGVAISKTPEFRQTIIDVCEEYQLDKKIIQRILL